MATWSWKTMIIASTIIEAFTKWYRKFLFFTNSSNLIEKTKWNIIKKYNSEKLEYNNDIINWKTIYIKEVERFSHDNNNIEIIFSTIHQLHSDINEKKENTITMNDLIKHDIVIIADEAHHFQAETKSKISKDEEKNIKSWENTIMKILNSNIQNKLLEFTATMDLHNQKLLEKYNDKIIYDFTLQSFREKWYSKNIKLIQAIKDDNSKSKVLTSLIVNEYRYLLSQKHNIPLIPRTLFKCQWKIEDLKTTQISVLSIIKKLSKKDLYEFIKSNMTYSIFKDIDLFLDVYGYDNFLGSLKSSFTENTSIIIHSKDSLKDKEEKLKILNRIDSNKKIRLIFNLNILNEWWDVLSLFDIVKMDDYKISWSKNTPTQEAQLIGRGARIFAYEYKDKKTSIIKDRYKRKFDNEINELRILETMYFYSFNDNNYINNISKSLKDMWLEEEKELKEVKPKQDITKLSQFHKDMRDHGYVFSNKIDITEKVLDENDLHSMNIHFDITKNYIASENELNDELIDNMNRISKYEYTNTELLIEKYIHIIIKALQKSGRTFYQFAKTKKEFIKILNWISYNIQNIDTKKQLFNLIMLWKTFEDISYNEKLSIFIDFFQILFDNIEKKKKKFTWTQEFHPRKINETFISYPTTKEIAQLAKDHDKWQYFYDSFTSDSWKDYEWQVKNIFKDLDPEKFIVIRNEVGYKLYNTESGEWFEPDFIIFKKESNTEIIQIFIEIKGEHLAEMETNKWKEELLVNLYNHPKKEIIEDNKYYRITWLPFLMKNNHREWEKDFQGVIS